MVVSGIELSPRSSNLVVSSCVYADLNWVLSISALLLLSLCIIPLLALMGATTELSCVLDFINDQKRLFCANNSIYIVVICSPSCFLC